MNDVEIIKAEIAELEKETAPTEMQSKQSTEDFKWFVLWYTWKHSNPVEEFDSWLAKNGQRLTRLWDTRILAEIASLKAKIWNETDRWVYDLTLRCEESKLSWQYTVPKEDRQQNYSFHIIAEGE